MQCEKCPTGTLITPFNTCEKVCEFGLIANRLGDECECPADMKWESDHTSATTRGSCVSDICPNDKPLKSHLGCVADCSVHNMTPMAGDPNHCWCRDLEVLNLDKMTG